MANRSDATRLTVEWRPQPDAAACVHDIVAEFRDGSQDIRRFADRLQQETGTRLIDWVDHVALPASDLLESRLERAGFVPNVRQADRGYTVPEPDRPRQVRLESLKYEHPGGLFPQVVTQPQSTHRLAIRVESVADFLAANGLSHCTRIEGEPRSPLRKARVGAEGDFEFWVVERHGYRGWETSELTAGQVAALLDYDAAFSQRRRRYGDAAHGFEEARALMRAAVGDLGAGRASDLFFAAERQYWTSRNRAAQFQKARQDALGLGWANHDHHTYRCGRENFGRLIALLEEMGLACRERFYAGRDAGWGAQVLEQEESQVVVFADVDLSAAEIREDFAHAPLAPQEHFGTVGLWCLLHGAAFFEPGMHHLECRFDFDAARAQFQQAGFRVMNAFTDLPYLKQAFTEAERWPVDAARLEAALAAGAITRQQAEQFRRDGVLGSHLEILQRDDGYKGFNPSGISEIIRATDPRRSPGDATAAGPETAIALGPGAA